MDLKVINLIFIRFLCIVVVSVTQIHALNPLKKTQEYYTHHWTTSDDLPQNTIHAIEQTQDGFLWIGTPSGLTRFDGNDFSLPEIFSQSPLKNVHITSIHEDKQNGLWIGTHGNGLFFLDENEWKHISTENGLSSNYVRDITSDTNGYLWIGTDFGLNRVGSDGITIFTEEDELYDNIITSLALDSRGYLWIGTLRGGLAQFQTEIVHLYGYQEGLSDMAVTALYADRSDNIWIGTLHGLYVMKGGNGVITYIQGSGATPINSISEDAEGTIWIGTMVDGLKFIQNNKMTAMPDIEGFSASFIHTVFSDQNDHLWIGSDANGLFQLQNVWVDNLDQSTGLPETPMTCIIQDDNKNLWVGSQNDGLFKFGGKKLIQKYNTSTELSSNHITSLCQSNDGTIWAGTRDRGLNSLENDSIHHLTVNHGLSSNYITSLLKHNNILWIGTDNGLNRLNFRTNKIDFIYETRSLHIHYLLKNGRNQIYLGTREGLFLYEIKKKQLISIDNRFSQIEILSLYQDNQQVLWMGTNGSGLIQFKDGSARFWGKEQGLPDNHIFSISEDDQGYLWLSSYSGVFRILKNQLDQSVKQYSSLILPSIFDENDGMISSRCSMNGYPSVWKPKSGLLYYPTASGVSIFDPHNVPIDTKPPKVYIEKVQADGQIFPIDSVLRLPPGIEHLTVHFTAIDFSSPEKLRFFYRLEGKDSVWNQSPTSRIRTAEYFHLSSGNYQFKVKAVNNSGIWSDLSVLSLNIDQPFYRKPFVYSTFLIIVILVSGTIMYLHHRRKAFKKLAKYKTSTLDPERAEKIVPQLLKLMEDDKIYLNPNLTLKDLSAKLKIHPNHLSRIINERFEMSFNDFVNSYRIKEAKRMLKDSQEENKTILEIIYDCGFYSKSVFNTAFKKFTGLTPSEYRKSQRN